MTQSQQGIVLRSWPAARPYMLCGALILVLVAVPIYFMVNNILVIRQESEYAARCAASSTPIPRIVEEDILARGQMIALSFFTTAGVGIIGAGLFAAGFVLWLTTRRRYTNHARVHWIFWPALPGFVVCVALLIVLGLAGKIHGANLLTASARQHQQKELDSIIAVQQAEAQRNERERIDAEQKRALKQREQQEIVERSEAILRRFASADQQDRLRAISDLARARQLLPDWRYPEVHQNFEAKMNSLVPTLRADVFGDQQKQEELLSVLEAISYNIKFETQEWFKKEKLARDKLDPLYTTKLAMNAIDLNNAAMLTKALDEGAPVNRPNAAGETLLAYAMNRDRVLTLKVLIDRGADIKIILKNGQTPLHYAVGRRDAALVKKLIDRGADINAPTRKMNDQNEEQVDNVTPLFAAVKTFRPEVVKLLLDNGADPNLVTREGLTPLDWISTYARHKGPPTIIRDMLLERGAKTAADIKAGQATAP